MPNISNYQHYLECKLLTVPTTQLTPHETRESNSMRSRRSIDVIHYALDDRGKPLKLSDNSPLLPGYKFIISVSYTIQMRNK